MEVLPTRNCSWFRNRIELVLFLSKSQDKENLYPNPLGILLYSMMVIDLAKVAKVVRAVCENCIYAIQRMLFISLSFSPISVRIKIRVKVRVSGSQRDTGCSCNQEIVVSVHTPAASGQLTLWRLIM